MSYKTENTKIAYLCLDEVLITEMSVYQDLIICYI